MEQRLFTMNCDEILIESQISYVTYMEYIGNETTYLKLCIADC